MAKVSSSYCARLRSYDLEINELNFLIPFTKPMIKKVY